MEEWINRVERRESLATSTCVAIHHHHRPFRVSWAEKASGDSTKEWTGTSEGEEERGSVRTRVHPVYRRGGGKGRIVGREGAGMKREEKKWNVP